MFKLNTLLLNEPKKQLFLKQAVFCQYYNKRIFNGFSHEIYFEFHIELICAPFNVTLYFANS
jgi:hypothetical protein